VCTIVPTQYIYLHPLIAGAPVGKSNPVSETNRDLNLDKFEDFVSELTTPSPPPWSSALSGLGKRLSKLPRPTSGLVKHDWVDTFRGYLLPDPGYFVRGYRETPDRVNKLLLVWLYLRSGWMARISTPNYTVEPGKDNEEPKRKTPSPQQWKDFLMKVGRGMGLDFNADSNSASASHVASSAHSSSTPRAGSFSQSHSASRGGMSRNAGSQSRHMHPPKKSKPRKKSQAEFEDEFRFSIDLQNWPMDLYWDGDIVRSKDTSLSIPLPLSTLRLIVWDLVENNWRAELLILDRCLVPRTTMTSAEQTERDNQVAGVFSGGDLIVWRMPMHDRGLGAEHWQHRAVYVEAFCELLSAWPGEEARRLAEMSAGTAVSDHLTAQNVLDMETVAYPFYCHMFFQYFGRAATIPCAMPRS